MLTCWNEDPEKRPPFSKLRSKFDAMLLADKSNHYIELQIDHNKLCYQNVTPMLKLNEGDFGSTRSLNAEHVGESQYASHSPSHWLHSSTEGGGDLVDLKQHFVPQETSGNIERKDQASGSTKRPISLHLPHDQNNLNPYVDPPSRVASTSLSLSTANWGGSNEAIEMKQLQSESVEHAY